MSVARIALIGCGRPARRWHLPTLNELAKKGAVDFVAVCDLDESLAAESGKTYGVPYYTRAEEMFEKHPDIMAVDVVTGDPTHSS